ncbi:MAG: hypothetical protein ACXADS_08540 [Candidatus Thorarchaeota archaeon]|jgi:hypothetical protein
MRANKMYGLLIVLLPLLFGTMFVGPHWVGLLRGDTGTRSVDLGDGMTMEVGPDEVLETYTIGDAPTEQVGTGNSLVGSEYGLRTDAFTGESMRYDSSSQTTATANLSVPLGEDWEGYEVYADVTSITENRTWIDNSDFSADTDWTYLTHDEPSTWGPYSNTLTSQWATTNAYFTQQGYWYDDRPTTQLYGYWYDVGDKSYAVQNLTINRGDVTQLAISLDYWADCAGWGSYMTGFFELFVSVGDPDNGGTYLWSIQFDAIQDDNQWYSTGLVYIDPALITLPDINLWIGLRTTQLEWYRSNDIRPQGRFDDVLLYVTAKATPEEVNLQMNGVDVDNVIQGASPVPGLGTVFYRAPIPWTSGAAYANFSWTPTPLPPDPNFDINVDIDADVTVYARSYNVDTIYDTETFGLGESYTVQNATDVQWSSNFYVAVPGGYSSNYFFNVSLPTNRDIDFVAEPTQRTVNLTSGWSFGNPGDGLVNVSAYQVTLDEQNGFWLLKGLSPNMVSNVEVWDSGIGQWVSTRTFRADEDTRFRAMLSSTYQDDLVNFTVYDSDGAVWHQLQATVDASGYAVTGFVNLDANNASVGSWQVQAYATDFVSGGAVHNVGFFSRGFDIEHGTDMAVQYPIGSESTWTKNVTYGELVLLQLRVNDTDNGELLAGGAMTYSWAGPDGSVNDLGTGEYSVTLDTNDLLSNGQFDIDLHWNLVFYDSLFRTFTLNVIYTTELLSSDAPGVDVPSGYNADLEVYFEDQNSQPITGASIIANWSMDDYTVTPVGGNPGYYTLSLETDAVSLDTYAVEITASKDFFESRVILLSVQVRELFTSAIPSTSQLSLPVGYTTSFTITYTDTDHGFPINGAESAIRCNWSDIHSFGDRNYTVAQTAPGLYEVSIYSEDLDVLGSYQVDFFVESYGLQNHTFTVTVVLRTHLTSFYLVNPINPTPYTGDVEVYVSYFDVDANVGIENGSIVGYNVHMSVTSSLLPSVSYSIVNGSSSGEYLIMIPANQWLSIDLKDLTIVVNWTGPTVKYYDSFIKTQVRVTGAPTDIFIGESPVMTPYGEDLSFTVVYYDVGNTTGVVNSTGPYAGNVHFYIDVLTASQALTQSLMTITEIDPVGSPGEYRIEFSTNHLSGIIACELRVSINWTYGAMPLYENQTLLITVHSTYRQTIVDYTPLPVTAFDEMVNLSLTYKDVLSATNIPNNGSLQITTPGYSFTVYYDGDVTRIFFVEVDTASFLSPGSHSFDVQIVWSGGPFYQNRTVSISITVRERYTSLTHGSYTPVQYNNDLTLLFTYTDLDDFTTTGMNGGTLTAIGMAGEYTVTDNNDGTYTLELETDSFPSTGTFMINVSMSYGGSRWCEDATDFFYLTIVERRTQLTSELPDLAPYLTLANITVLYIDDSTAAGIAGATLFASCATADQTLVLDSNYWVVDRAGDLGTGYYTIRINTTALGNFGRYTIEVTANWTGQPFYMERVRNVDIEVSRRPVSFTVSKSPLNTPYMENVTFEISIFDFLSVSPISVDKSTLILSHNGGTSILDSEYSISGSSGVYAISVNSTILTAVLVTGHPISVKFFWGDSIPYYANATTSTQVDVSQRFTQGRVLSTPAAFYSFNISATIEYSDYLTGRPISGATVTFICLNDSSFWSDINDLGDGSYRILVDTNDLSGIGRYYFRANFTWSGPPFYDNVYGLEFSVVVNPVSTSLNFVLLVGETYYLGDLVIGNITFTDILYGRGIENATITSDWNSTYPTDAIITPLGNGVYRMSINTSGLDAQIYSFAVNASKFLHLNRSITADILLAAIPVEIELVFTPTNPEWGEQIEMSANVTDARNGDPIVPTIPDPEPVNLTIAGTTYVMVHLGGGIYNVTVPTTGFVAGEYTISVRCSLLNHESRQRDFQIRIYKVAAKISATLDPQVAVNGQMITVEADYRILSDDTAISIGIVTYSWVGGTGILTWNGSMYTGQFMVDNAAVGNHQILIQASSSIYKSVTTPFTIEVTEIGTSLSAYQGMSVLSAVSGDTVNVTVYLNNTALGLPVTGGTVSYSMPGATGFLTDIGGGHYSGDVPTGSLQIGDWILTVSAAKAGFTPSSTEFTITILRVPTTVQIVGEALKSAYYGQNVTFALRFRDIHNGVGITNATATYVMELTGGTLVEIGGGDYTLTVNTTWVAAGMLSHDISVTFQKTLYDYAYGVVKLVSLPIPTEVTGPTELELPVGDLFSQVFQFNDTLHNALLDNASATAFWEFGADALTPLGGGVYRFGFAEANMSRLEIRETPYRIRIQFSKANYSVEEITFLLTIREIHTELRITSRPTVTYVRQVFYVEVTYWDLDHGVAVEGAFNSTSEDLPNLPESALDYGDGRYRFAFSPPQVDSYRLVITMGKQDFEEASETLIIHAEFPPETQTLLRGFMWGGMVLILIAGLAAAYVRVWSVPKLLRILRRMVALLRKGQVPAPADVRDRRTFILETMNEELVPVGVTKTYQDVAPSTVEVEALDVERLLDELQTVIGLTEDDVAVLRHDLDRMRPSERAGFIGEVLKQERARRARELAEAEIEAEVPEVVAEAERKLTEEELEHLREELIKMGIEPSEADLMVEQARTLTKAEIDALLDQIGGLKE